MRRPVEWGGPVHSDTGPGEVGGGSAGRAVVIGAGVAGLATAALLAEDGWDVVLLEGRAVVGGRAGEWARDGYRFETGPSWYLMPEVFEHFFQLLGTTASEQLELVRLSPGYRVVFEGDGDAAEVVDVAADRSGNLELAERLEPGSAPALGRYLDSAGRMRAMAVRRFLYTDYDRLLPLLTPEVVAGLPRLLPMLTRSLHAYIARRFQDPRLRQILAYHSVFLGGSPFTTPAMYHLMSSLDLDDGVQYPRGGFSSLVHAMRKIGEERGVRVRTSSAATEIETRPGRQRARVTGVRTAAGDVEPADLAVSTMDLEVAERTLLPKRLRSRSAGWWSRREPGPSAVLILLGVRGALPQLLHHTLVFSRDWRTNFAAVVPDRHRPTPTLPDELSLYVCRPSATEAVLAPEGCENLFVLVPVAADPATGQGGVDGAGDPEVEAVADRAIRQLAKWLDVPDLAERIQVRRTIGPGDFAEDLGTWRGTAFGPSHTLLQSALFRARNRNPKVDGLLYAGVSTLPGVGLPMSLISAELVLKRIRGVHGTSPLPAPIRPARADAPGIPVQS